MLNNVYFLGNNILKFDIQRQADEVIYQFPARGEERYGVKYIVPMDIDQFKREVQQLRFRNVSFARVGEHYVQFTLSQ